MSNKDLLATLSPKNQTTLPREVRDHLKLSPGDKMLFTVLPDGRVAIERVSVVVVKGGESGKPAGE